MIYKFFYSLLSANGNIIKRVIICENDDELKQCMYTANKCGYFDLYIEEIDESEAY